MMQIYEVSLQKKYGHIFFVHVTIQVKRRKYTKVQLLNNNGYKIFLNTNVMQPLICLLAKIDRST